MTKPLAERRSAPGVAVLSAKTPPVTSVLQQIGIPYRALLVQERGALPPLRPPVVLDTAGMGTLDLARVLENLAAGCAGGAKAGAPLPAIAVVEPEAFAHRRLLACCAAIVAVVAAPADPRTLTVMVRQSGVSPAHAQDGALWFGLARPPLAEPCPELCGLLLALDSAVKLQDAAATLNVSRATFFRRLEMICAALGLTRPKQSQLAEHWLKTLLEALNASIEPAGSTGVPHEP